MRITARYESAAALAADVESQLGHGGLLVRGEVPARLQQFATIELAVVCGGAAVVVAAQVLQFFPGVGVAVAVDAAAQARIAALAAGTPAPVAAAAPASAMYARRGAAPGPAAVAAAVADTQGAGRAPAEDAPTARVARAGALPADEEVPTAPRVARTATAALVAEVPRAHTATGAPVAAVPRARTATDAPVAEVPRARTATGAPVAEVPRARTATGAPVAEVPRAHTATGAPVAAAADATVDAVDAAPARSSAGGSAAGMVEKIQRALKGDRETRFAILRDVNRAVHIHVLRNPGLMIDEIAAIARMPTVSVEALAQIATRREWGHRPEIAIALVRNPTVPVPVAIELLAYVNESDLKQLAKDNRTRDPVQRAARRKLLK